MPNVTLLSEYECKGEGTENNKKYFVRTIKGTNNEIACETAAFTDNALLMTTATVGSGKYK